MMSARTMILFTYTIPLADLLPFLKPGFVAEIAG